jgi:hypothetical protein
MENISRGKKCKGKVSIQELSRGLSPRAVRRLKRLPRLALSLAIAAQRFGGDRRAFLGFLRHGVGRLVGNL